ncbi:MFS transporter [Clostridium sp. DL1XJH146]
MKEKTIKKKIMVTYFSVYGAYACYFPFLYLYFKDKNLNFYQVGIAFAVNALVGVLFQPVWGYITDQFSNKKRTLIISMIGSIIFIMLLPLANSFIFILIFIFLFMLFQCALFPVLDAFCYELMVNYRSIEFGRMRLMGSAGFAISALFIGYLIKLTGLTSSYYFYGIFMIIAIINIYNIKVEGKSENGKIKFDIRDVRELLKRNTFIVFILSAFFANLALGGTNVYLSVLIDETGGASSQLGILWFITAMSEIPIFFYFKKLVKRFGIIKLYLFSLIIYAIRMYLSSIVDNYTYVIIIQLLQSITFTIFLASAMEYLNTVVPEKMRTTGITIYSSIAAGFANFTGNLLGGTLLNHISVFILFRLFSISFIIAFIIGLILQRYLKKAPSFNKNSQTT